MASSLETEIREQVLHALEPLVEELVRKALQKMSIASDEPKKVKVTIPKKDDEVSPQPPKKEPEPSPKPKTLKKAVETSEKKRETKKVSTEEWSCPRIKKGQTEPCGKSKGSYKEIDGKKYCLACAKIVEGGATRAKKDPLPPPTAIAETITAASSSSEKKMSAVADLLAKMNENTKKTKLEPTRTTLKNGDVVYIDGGGYVYERKTGHVSGKVANDKVTRIFDEEDRKYIQAHRLTLTSDVSYKRIDQAPESSGSDDEVPDLDITDEDSIELDLSDNE